MQPEVKATSGEVKAEGTKRPPGTCIPWEEKRKELGEIKGDEELIKRIWENIDALGYMYIWQILLSF